MNTPRNLIIVVSTLLLAACDEVKMDGKVPVSESSAIEYKIVTIGGREYIATRIRSTDSRLDSWSLCPKLPTLPEKP
jgi:hypothetical protein